MCPIFLLLQVDSTLPCPHSHELPKTHQLKTFSHVPFPVPTAIPLSISQLDLMSTYHLFSLSSFQPQNEHLIITLSLKSSYPDTISPQKKYSSWFWVIPLKAFITVFGRCFLFNSLLVLDSLLLQQVSCILVFVFPVPSFMHTHVRSLMNVCG